MNKNRKYGFTLVELLAVIVILAVVILIAVTAVVPRMNNAKKKSFVDEALVYMKAAKEAYVTDPSTECYNIADMGNLVKQSKSGYSGTVYVNEKEVSLNITNGKYYIKTNTNPNELDIVETMPDKYVSSCSEVKEYDIEYELPSDATVSGNPSKYRTNENEITLNNPTRPGYRFVGWSSKNVLDINNWMKGVKYAYNGNFTIMDNKFTLDATGNDCYTMPMEHKESNTNKVYLNGGETYTLSWDANPKNISALVFVFYSPTTWNGRDSLYVHHITFQVPDDNYVTMRFGVQNSGNSAMYSNIQLEKGTTATDYQEYMEPTTTAKIYRGSTGNKKFISNWEAL